MRTGPFVDNRHDLPQYIAGMGEEMLYLVVLGVFAGIMVITWLIGGITVFWAVVGTLIGTFAWARLPESDESAAK